MRRTTDYQLNITEGTGWPETPFVVHSSTINGNSDLLELLGEHLRRMGLQREWQSLQIVDHHTHQQGLQTLHSFEVNYEQLEAGQMEYFSAVIWYDITEPWSKLHTEFVH
ncbi:hypothetical protein XMG59_002227 [Marinobacterium sp. xm-g-59]|uniref:hypothetical protein n=1 Tax=Marinobacterium sp. xm-g-59 TaxID=2497748 RepID=UPI001568521C|nr:hypothetical protein [Marinobacterium sp. xm-g-59]NRP96109.1 hypothetical protein [Marinobacterium sp. xm-g-59]